MKSFINQALFALLVIVLFLTFFYVAKADDGDVEGVNEGVPVEEVLTVSGVVNSNFQIISDYDGVYNISQDGIGLDLFDYEGRRLEVTGNVIEEGGEKIITVTSFKALKK